MTSSIDGEAPLPADWLDVIARHGTVRTFQPQAILVNEGDPTDSLYIVLSGRLLVYASSEDGREVVLAELGPGTYFGELALDGGPRSASVRAVEPSRCCIVQSTELRQLLIDHPPLSVHLSLKLMRMVRRLTDQVRSLALQDVYGRIARVLSELSDPVGDERVVREKLTQQDIANRVASSREMVNRVLKELQAGGYVSVRHGHHVIHKRLPARW